MGMSGARRLDRMLQNLRHTVAIETALRLPGHDLLAPLQTEHWQRGLRSGARKSAKVVQTGPLGPEIEAVSALVAGRHVFSDSSLNQIGFRQESTLVRLARMVRSRKGLQPQAIQLLAALQVLRQEVAATSDFAAATINASQKEMP